METVIEAMIAGVKALGMETCMTLGYAVDPQVGGAPQAKPA